MSARKIILNWKILIALSLLVSSFSFPQQTARPWKNVPHKIVLDNGLVLIRQKDESSALTVLRILIKGGKGAEPLGKEGLAYLTTRLALEIPDSGKVQDLMSQSSYLSMTSRGDYSLINIDCLSENLEDTLKIVSKIMIDPLFSGIRIDSIKRTMLHQQKVEEDDALNVGRNAHLKSFFGKTAYGGSIFGDEVTLKAIKNKDISSFYENYFNASNMIIAIISDLDEEKLLEMMRKYFGKFPVGKTQELGAPSALIPEERTLFVEKDTRQSLVSIGFPLPGISAKNFILGLLVENLLGKGVASRLWPLRIKEKFAYNVNSQATQMIGGGILEAYLETDTKKKEGALEALKKVLSDLSERGITEEELQVTKAYAKANFLRSNETKEIRTTNLASFEALGLGYDFLSRLFAEVDAVSLEEINAYIKDVINLEKAFEVVVGRKG